MRVSTAEVVFMIILTIAAAILIWHGSESITSEQNVNYTIEKVSCYDKYSHVIEGMVCEKKVNIYASERDEFNATLGFIEVGLGILLLISLFLALISSIDSLPTSD